MLAIVDLVPAAPDWKLPVRNMETALCGLHYQMARTPQDPVWHGEGDVLTHTFRVCEALTQMAEFRNTGEKQRQILFLAALFHDIGKIRTTVQENGRWISPAHGKVGAAMTRRILWQNFGLCGTPAAQQLRESVCQLIRFHSLPPRTVEEADGKLRLMRFAANGELTPDTTVELLCLLAKADILGRICPDGEELLEKVQLCEELAKELGCWKGPYPFPTEHTAVSYLAGKKILPEYTLYDDTWGEVILLSGLPGTGKDTWIRAHCGGIPMISLDDIRREFGFSPTGDQTQVAQIGRERAKDCLRRKQAFVWNATNITAAMRGRLIGLFSDYGASVRIVYLETGWDEQLRRNAEREAAVPEQAICAMLDRLEPPQRQEARKVQWICV